MEIRKPLVVKRLGTSRRGRDGVARATDPIAELNGTIQNVRKTWVVLLCEERLPEENPEEKLENGQV